MLNKKFSIPKIGTISFNYDEKLEEASQLPFIAISTDSPELKLDLEDEVGKWKRLSESDSGGPTEFRIDERKPEVILEGNLFNALTILVKAHIVSDVLYQEIVNDKELGAWLRQNKNFELPEEAPEAKEDQSPTDSLTSERFFPIQMSSGGKEEKERKSDDKKEGKDERSEKESEEKELTQFSELVGDTTNKQEMREIQLAAKEIRLATPKAFSKLCSILKERRNKVASSLSQQSFFQTQTTMKSKDASSDPVVETGEAKLAKQQKS